MNWVLTKNKYIQLLITNSTSTYISCIAFLPHEAVESKSDQIVKVSWYKSQDLK